MGKTAAAACREVRVTLPSEVAAQYGDGDEEAGLRLRELAVVDLVRTGRISSGYGSRALGVSLYEFIKILAKHQVSVFDDDEDSLAAERETIERLIRKAP